MKQIFKNRYLKSFKFLSVHEVRTFINNQDVNRSLSIDETFGDYQYCYMCYNSLTSEKEFLIYFSSEEKEEDLNFLFWEDAHLFVIETGKNIYFIDQKELNIKVSFVLTTPLIGLYLTGRNNLVVLEEASYKLISKEGKVLSNEVFDLIEDFSLSSNRLTIQTSEEKRTFELL